MNYTINRKLEKEGSYRLINLLDLTQSVFKPNTIQSQTHSLLTGILKSLLRDFLSIPYLWFIVLIGLDLSDLIPTVSLKCSISIPLLLILIISCAKTAGDNISRSKHDKTKNETIVRVLTESGFIEKKTCQVCVGEYVLVHNKETVPADIVVLAIDSLEESFFVDMTAIVGGKNFTQKRPVRETQAYITQDGYDSVKLFKYLENVKISQPNNSFQKFSGKLKLKGNPRAIKLNLENFVVRDSIVACNWIFGVVVYTGMETKVWINSKKSSFFKVSKLNRLIDRIMSHNLIYIWIGILVCFGLSFLYEDQGDLSALVVNFIILFYTFIPISLYFSQTLSKLGQMLVINLRNPDIQIKNQQIFENLGRVEYILSGKSGVLTDDDMKVQACLIGKRLYVEKQDYKLEERFSLKSKNSENLLKDDELINGVESSSQSLEDLVQELLDFYKSVETEETDSRMSTKIEPEIWYFMLCLTVCNYFHNEKTQTGQNTDEKLMFDLAEKLGYTVSHRSLSTATLKFYTYEHKLDITPSQSLYSEQKISKVVVKNRETGESILLVKGKLEAVLNLFDNLEENMAIEDSFQFSAFQNLQKIIFGYKVFTEAESEEFNYDYKTAKLAPVNVEGRIESVFEKHEKNLKLLGIVGIENPIKPGVTEAIQDLSEAGIKTWIVTGDSEESALLTGAAIGLYDKKTKILKFSKMFSSGDFLNVLKSSESHELFGILTRELELVPQFSGTVAMMRSEMNFGSKETSPLKKQIKSHFKRKNGTVHPNRAISELPDEGQDFWPVNTENLNYVISVDAAALEYVFTSNSIRKKFVTMIFAAKSVFFHSMMPDHKIKLIRLLKNNMSFKPTVLAIGDGNTNSGMLGEADIGISAQGSKDENLYTRDSQLSSFACLSRLIIKFGHLGEVRSSKILLLSIYKAVLLNCVLFFYQIESGFSALNLIDYDLIVLFDLLITLVPLVIVGVFYEDYENEEELVSFQMYSQGYLNSLFCKEKIFRSYFEGCLHAAVIYIFVVFGLSDICNSSGYTEDLGIKGILAFILVNLAFTTKVCFENWTQPLTNVLITLFTLVLLLIVVPVTLGGYLTSYSLSQTEFQRQPQMFFIIFLLPLMIFTLCVVVDVFIRLFSNFQLESRIGQFKDNIYECFVDTNEWQVEEDSEDTGEKLFDIKFKSSFKEEEYQRTILPPRKKMFKIFNSPLFCIIWVFFILKCTLDSGDFKSGSLSVIPPIIITVSTAAMLYDQLNWIYFIFTVFLGYMLFTITLTVENSMYSAYYYPVLCFAFSVGINLRFRLAIIKVSMTFSLLVITRFVQESKWYQSSIIQLALPSSLLMLEISLLSLIITYNFDLNHRKEFVKLKQLKNEARTYKNILSYLLPEFIRKRVKEGERYIAEDKGTVSVIFLDMCNFDDIVTWYSPQELTGFLDDIFGRIDKLCETIGVTKIETVGKTYLACAGLKDSEGNMDPRLTSVPHARRAIELGLAVIREVKKIVLKDGNHLMFKVGINSGPVTAGVVGFHKPQFSLVGDTVNTASRMSSTLTEPNSIQISLGTYNLIGDKTGLNFTDNCPDVKGKGKMDTKIVTVASQGYENADRNLSLPAIIANSFGAGLGGSGRYSSCKSETSNPRLVEVDSEMQEILVKDKNVRYVNDIISFQIKESSVEREFREKNIESSFLTQYYGFLMNAVVNVMLTVLEIFFFSFNLKYSSRFRLSVYAIDSFAAIILFILLKKHRKSLFFAYLASLLLSIDYLAFFIYSLLHYYPSQFFFELFCLRYISVNNTGGLFFNRLLILNVSNLCFWLAVNSLQDQDPQMHVFTILFVLTVLYCKFLSESNLRAFSVHVENATRETEQTEELLTNMLPHQALKELKEENFSTDRISYVTVMYADIVGFTAWSSVRQPKEVVLKLSQLFTTFDKLCISHNVYKVHTIGDCYVVMGFQSDRNRNPAKEAVNVVEFAEALIRVIEESNTEEGYKLSMRVGIHTGEVIGGITGTNIVRYDIYGADILIANKMESNGEPGKVVVSEMTKGLLEDYLPERFCFEMTKEISIPVLNKTVKIFRISENEASE